jgi:hypothetical protein
MTTGKSSLIVAAVMGAAAVTAAPLRAQAWHYPSFQPPTIVTREFNFAVAGGGDVYGTTGIAQWREGIGPETHLEFEIGFADPGGAGDTGFIIGGGIGQRVLRATPDIPLDMVFTGGLYGDFAGDVSFIRLPVGVSIGHRFALQRSRAAIIPYAHPRFSVDFCASDCAGIGTELKLNFDFGADFEVTRMLSLRGLITVGGVSEGESEVGFGLGLAIRPTPLRR